MKKTLILFCVLFTSRILLVAQSVTPENFYTIKARKDAYYDSLRAVVGDAAVNDDESGYGQYQAWLRNWEPLVSQFGGDFVALSNAMNTNYQARLSNPPSVSSLNSNWLE